MTTFNATKACRKATLGVIMNDAFALGQEDTASNRPDRVTGKPSGNRYRSLFAALTNRTVKSLGQKVALGNVFHGPTSLVDEWEPIAQAYLKGFALQAPCAQAEAEAAQDQAPLGYNTCSACGEIAVDANTCTACQSDEREDSFDDNADYQDDHGQY
jgi:hypothetical protein